MHNSIIKNLTTYLCVCVCTHVCRKVQIKIDRIEIKIDNTYWLLLEII